MGRNFFILMLITMMLLPAFAEAAPLPTGFSTPKSHKVSTQEPHDENRAVEICVEDWVDGADILLEFVASTLEPRLEVVHFDRAPLMLLDSLVTLSSLPPRAPPSV